MPSARGPRSKSPPSAEPAGDGPAKEGGGDPPLGKLVALLGSLQLALLLLAGTCAILIAGTFLESWYGGAVAAQLIYQAWWFGYLLALLAVNIACAALKKWPWKRHQTGFLITHIGLLTLLAGGALSAGFGTSGMLLLVDNPDLASPAFGAPADDHLLDRRRDTLRVRHADQADNDYLEVDFAPAWIPWNEAGLKAANLNLFARGLAWIAQPWSPARRWNLDDLEIEILEYAPQAEWAPIRPASADTRRDDRFAAARFRIDSPLAGRIPAEWVADREGLGSARLGPGLVLWQAGRMNSQQLAEFGREPSDDDRKDAGELVVGWGTRQWRWPVRSLLDRGAIELADGWRLEKVKFHADALRQENRTPVDPAVSFELRTPDDERYGLVTTARRAGATFPLPGYPRPDRLPPGFWVWYHAPDPAFADRSLRGLLRFATSERGDLWVRSLHRGPNSQDRWIAEPSTPWKEGSDSLPVWPAMQGKLTVEQFVAEAEAIPHARPRERVGESEDPNAPPAIRCRLRSGGSSAEVWLPRRPQVEVLVPLGSQTIGLAYAPRREPLGFSVELGQVTFTTEAASGMPDVQQSELKIRDADGSQTTGVTTLNEPFVHRGYKLYQGMIQPLGKDEQGQPLHRTVLIVGYDPGVWLKYGGSLLACLGIACMFWMKAYFFGSWWGDEGVE